MSTVKEKLDIVEVYIKIEDMITERKQKVENSKSFSVFKVIDPIRVQDIYNLYKENNVNNIDITRIMEITKRINHELKDYLTITFKTRVLNELDKKRINDNNFKNYINEEVVEEYTNDIGFNDQTSDMIKKDILDRCNDKVRMNSLLVADHIVKHVSMKINKNLDIAYRIAVADILYDIGINQIENKPITNKCLRMRDVVKLTTNKEDIIQSDFEEVSNELDNLISSMIATSIRSDVVRKYIEDYDSGIRFKSVTIDELMLKYNLSRTVAQKLATEVNYGIRIYIKGKEKLTDKKLKKKY